MEKTDSEVCCMINRLSVGLDDAIGDSEFQPAENHPLEINDILDLFGGREHHVRELDLADTECAAAARCPEPAKVKTAELPKRVEPKTTWHDGVAFEVAVEKPV